MPRHNHEFHFKASDIAAAAKSEAEYHESRVEFWTDEMDKSLATVKRTAKVAVEKRQITGGWRADVVVDYGDPSAYARMQEAAAKIQSHRDIAQKFRTDEKVYGTQANRVYELNTEDVHHFRLGGGQREE